MKRNEKKMQEQINQMFKDIAEAPTGGVDENFNIRPLKDQLSGLFISTLAGHLIASNWRKQSEVAREIFEDIFEFLNTVEWRSYWDEHQIQRGLIEVRKKHMEEFK